MSQLPIPEQPEISEILVCDLAVHLILHIEGDWDGARQASTDELNRKTQVATAFARSPAFAAKFGARIGVLRVQTRHQAPSIVASLLHEQGIELEPTANALPTTDSEPPQTCCFCARGPLSAEQAQMTDSGWACPSCLRAWTVKQQPELMRPPRQLSIPRKLWLPLAILVAALFCIGTYLELRRLNRASNIIRMHMPG